MLVREKLNFFKKSAKFLNSSLVVPGPRGPSPVLLQPAVDRQPGYRRGDREEVGRKKTLQIIPDITEITQRSCSNNLKIFLKIQIFIIFLTPKCQTSANGFPKLQAIEEQTLLHAPPQYQ